MSEKNKRKWLTVSETITLIALLVSTGSTIYFAWRSYTLQNSLYSLTYFQPYIYSNYTGSTLNSMYCARNDTLAFLDGLVTVDLKVVTPYDGLLTVNVTTLNVTDTYPANSTLDMTYSNLNYTEHSPSYIGTTIPQYFISKNVVNSIEAKLLVELAVILKPNWLPLNSTGIGFDLGNLGFKANLFAVQTNQTMTKAFIENVYGMFTPTS